MKTENRRARRFRSARAVGMTFFGAIGTVVIAASTAWACTVLAAAYLFVVPPGGTDFLVTEGNKIAAIDPLQPHNPIGPVDVDPQNYTGEAGLPIAVVGFCGGGAQACDGYQEPLGYTPNNNGVIAVGGLYMAPHGGAPEHYLFVNSGVPIRDPDDAFGNKPTASSVTSMQSECGRNAGSTQIGQVVYNAVPIDAPVVQDGKAPLTVVAGEGQIPANLGGSETNPVPDSQTGEVVPLETGKYVICADPLPAHIWNFFTIIL